MHWQTEEQNCSYWLHCDDCSYNVWLDDTVAGLGTWHWTKWSHVPENGEPKILEVSDRFYAHKTQAMRAVSNLK